MGRSVQALHIFYTSRRKAISLSGARKRPRRSWCSKLYEYLAVEICRKHTVLLQSVG